MGAWFIDRVLPSLVSSLIVIGISHIRLRRHITRVTQEQTRALKGGGEGGSNDRTAETDR